MHKEDKPNKAKAMGPLTGVKIIEFAGLGPGPFCGMMLCDMGAEVICIDRKSERNWKHEWLPSPYDLMNRGKQSVILNLKKHEAVAVALRLIERADALIEGYRPGVMERFGLGPDVCFSHNRKLVYGRMTGWGQNGPLAHAAGHDINYISLTGALYSMGDPHRPPTPPLNLLGDFGGGGMLMAFGILCGLLEAKSSGRGQVVDAAIVDGSMILMTSIYGFKAAAQWLDERGTNLPDGSAHWYTVYECADGQFISIGALEPQFYELLLEKCGMNDPEFHAQMDIETWGKCKAKLAALFRTKSRDEWCKAMEGSDICFAPVLTLEEAPKHAHNIARQTFVEVDGICQPSPAPRFSRTKAEIQSPPPVPGAQTDKILAEHGFGHGEIELLRRCGAI